MGNLIVIRHDNAGESVVTLRTRQAWQLEGRRGSEGAAECHRRQRREQFPITCTDVMSGRTEARGHWPGAMNKLEICRPLVFLRESA